MEVGCGRTRFAAGDTLVVEERSVTDRKRGGTTPWLQAVDASASKPPDSAPELGVEGSVPGATAAPSGQADPAVSLEELPVEPDPAHGRDAHARTGPVTGLDALADPAFNLPPALFDDGEEAETSRVEIGRGSGPHESAFAADTLGRGSHPGQPPDGELGPGERLGPTYRVVEKLGEGGMGTIYAVEHIRMRKLFAAKVLKSALCTADNIKRMEREATASSRIDHPCVVRVVNLDEDEAGRLFIISELLEGRDLSVRLRQGPIPSDEAIGIAIQVAAGLGAAHAKGVIHRDLKPENIFLCSQEAPGPIPVKVLDFGISSMLFEADMERLTAVGSLIGTPRYMSPEHASRDPVDARSDIYSFGILLFEMLTGAVPFDHAQPMQVILMHLRDLPPPPSASNASVPAEFDRVVLKCLAKSPEARYPDMDAVADDLQSIADASGWSVPLIRSSVPTREVRGFTPAPGPVSLPAERVVTEKNPPPTPTVPDAGPTRATPAALAPPSVPVLGPAPGSPWPLRAAVIALLAALAAGAVYLAVSGTDPAVGAPPALRRVIVPKHKVVAPPSDSPGRTGGDDLEHDDRDSQP